MGHFDVTTYYIYKDKVCDIYIYILFTFLFIIIVSIFMNILHFFS